MGMTYKWPDDAWGTAVCEPLVSGTFVNGGAAAASPGAVTLKLEKAELNPGRPIRCGSSFLVQF